MTSRRHSWRLYCLVSDLETAHIVAAELRQLGVGADRLRVVAWREQLIVGLPEAGLLERSAIAQAARRGLAMGGIAGFVTGIVAAVELSVGLAWGCSLAAAGAVGGSLFGAWASAMMGIDEPHSTIRPYQRAIESGQVLIIIHADREQFERIENLIGSNHPDATIDRVS